MPSWYSHDSRSVTVVGLDTPWDASDALLWRSWNAMITHGRYVTYVIAYFRRDTASACDLLYILVVSDILDLSIAVATMLSFAGRWFSMRSGKWNGLGCVVFHGTPVAPAVSYICLCLIRRKQRWFRKCITNRNAVQCIVHYWLKLFSSSVRTDYSFTFWHWHTVESI